MFYGVGNGSTTAFTMDDAITMLHVRRSIENPIRFALLRPVRLSSRPPHDRPQEDRPNFSLEKRIRGPDICSAMLSDGGRLGKPIQVPEFSELDIPIRIIHLSCLWLRFASSSRACVALVAWICRNCTATCFSRQLVAAEERFERVHEKHLHSNKLGENVYLHIASPFHAFGP
jgi:hypothetical protein